MSGKREQSAPWKNRIVGHGEQAASQFMANPLNWRIHPKAQREALTGVLSEVGWVQSVIVNRTTGNVVDGHARIEEALKLGDETPVPFIEVELSEEEEQKILLTLDPISAMAAADKANLESLLQDVSTASSAVANMLTELAEKNGLEYGATIGGELEEIYTSKIQAPIYEITGEKPELKSLFDESTAKKLTDEIDRADIPSDVKYFLRLSAMRHVVFDYGKIAEYYAHASADIQRLFENSALVIIDFDRAIELGYVKLSKIIFDQYIKERDDE